MKKLILFGTGKYGMEALNFFGRGNVLYFTDNNKGLQGKEIDGIRIISPKELNRYKKDAVVVLAAGDTVCLQMEYQLKKQGVEVFLNYRFVRKFIDKEKRGIDTFLKISAQRAWYIS